jgi:hypothetical protein
MDAGPCGSSGACIRGKQVFGSTGLGPCGGSKAHVSLEVGPQVATGAGPCSTNSRGS